MTVRVHPFPSRTRQLSSLVSTILGWKRPGTIDRCQHRKDLLHDVRKVFRFVCGSLRRKMAEIRYRYGAERESGPLPDGIVRRTGWRAVSRETEPFLRGEEICLPPQFPVPEVRLPIGAVGRMGTGSSVDLTVAGSPRLPSFSERTYGEQFRCRHFPRDHMGNSSVTVIFRENIWGTAPLPAGLFSFFGARRSGHTVGRFGGRAYGTGTVSIRCGEGERPAAGWDRTANRMEGCQPGDVGQSRR